MHTAKLPDRLVAVPKPELKDINIGETVFLRRTAMYVTAERDCYLDPAATFDREKSRNIGFSVERRDDGFHVTIIYKALWTPGRSPQVQVENWIPVASLEEKLEVNPYDEMVKESQVRLKDLEAKLEGLKERLRRREEPEK